MFLDDITGPMSVKEAKKLSGADRFRKTISDIEKKYEPGEEHYKRLKTDPEYREQEFQKWQKEVHGDKQVQEDSWTDGANSWSSEHDQWAKESVNPEEDNFTPDDLKSLERIRDLPTLKARAKELIKGKPVKRMKPEKIAFFYNRVDELNSPLAIIKMLYDMLLAGEGHKVIGSKSSMNPNSYRARFGENTNEGATVAYVTTYFDTKTGDRGESTVSALTKQDAADKIVQLMHERGYDIVVTRVRPAINEGDDFGDLDAPVFAAIDAEKKRKADLKKNDPAAYAKEVERDSKNYGRGIMGALRRKYDMPLDEFAPGGIYKPPVIPRDPGKGPFEDDPRSATVAQVQKLLDAGKSVFVLLPGAKGRAIGTQMGDDHSWLNVQYKGWKDPKTRSRSRLTVNLKADDDESLKLSPGSQFTDNKDRPFDYTLTGSANTSGRGLGEGWFSKAEPGVDDAGKELMKQDRQAHPDMDDYSWQIGWIYAEGDKDVKAAYSDAYYDNPTIPSPPEPRSFKLGFDARKNQGVAEAAVNDINFGHTVGKGSWIVYDPETKQIKKRFKTHTAGKSYAKVHGLGFASSEFYFDRVKGKEVAESDSGDYDYPYTMSARDKGRYDAMTGREYNNPYSAFGTQEDHKNAIEYSAAYDSVNDEGVAEEETDYSKRRQRERDIDAGKPVEPEDEDDGETDYSRRRAQQKKELELGEAPVAMPPPRPPAIVRSAPAVPSKPIAPRAAPTSKKSDDTVVNPTTQPWYQGWLSNATKPTPSDDKKDDKKKDVKESYWTKLQAERSTKLNSLVNELKESLK